MDVGKVKLEDLVSPEWNPRIMSEREMNKLKKSIEEFDYVDPIIVNKHNNHIVGGNQRFMALKAMGYEEIDVVFIDEPDINKEKALNVALNKISGYWDNDKLESIFDELNADGFDIELTGFDALEFTEFKLENDLEYKEFDFDDSDLEDEYEQPVTTKLICPKCGFIDDSEKFKKKEVKE